MASVNKVILLGHLGRDPEVKSFQNGGMLATVSLATSESWKDRQTGERVERTEWHSVVFQGEGLAKVAERFLRKGSKVYVEGQLRTRKWQDQSGNDRYSTEIVVGVQGKLVMLDGPQGGDGQGGERGQQGQQRSGGSQWGGGSRGGQQSSNNDRGNGWGDNQGQGQSWGGGGGFSEDLDDDIPF